MKRALRILAGSAVMIAALAAASLPAGASGWGSGQDLEFHHGHPWGEGTGRDSADLSLVHGVPGLSVDIYVVKNFSSFKELADVSFGTATDVATDFPGWVTPGIYTVDVVPAGSNPFHPLLLTTFGLGDHQSKTVAAYVTADAAGNAGSPTLGVFTNDVSSTGGQARVTVRHLAVAPTVGVYADGAVAITPAFSNGQTAVAQVPSSSYDVSVTAPNAPSTVLVDLGSVTLPANTNVLAFAIGTYGSSFEVVSLAVPTRM
jgi:hypothetical protein